MSEINHFKIFVLCKIMLYHVGMIYQLLDNIPLDN
jgi:hypothetical protein